VLEIGESVQLAWRPSRADSGTLLKPTVPEGALCEDVTVTVHVMNAPTATVGERHASAREVEARPPPIPLTTTPASKFVPLSCDIETGELVQIVSGASKVDARAANPPPPVAQNRVVLEDTEDSVMQINAVAVLGRLVSRTSK
jgi:hypothetical protein